MSWCVVLRLGGGLLRGTGSRSQGCPWDADTCSNAASYGHMILLQWARSQGCPWNESTCSSAASNGHLEVLQWARSQECCSWSKRGRWWVDDEWDHVLYDNSWCEIEV